MTKITKISGISMAILLIALDFFVIANSLTLSVGNIINNIINYSLPCGMLLGITLLAAIFEKPSKKSLSITTLVLFSVSFAIRFLAIVLYVLELIFFANDLVTVGANEYMELAKYAAFTLLALGVVFLMLYLRKGKFEKTALTLGGVSCVALFAVWGIYTYSLISSSVEYSAGLFEIFLEFYNGELLRDVVVIVSYITSFWVINEINKEKEKKA